MHCIVGLGNPEPRYFPTRHNAGFQIVESCAESLGCNFQKAKGNYLTAKGRTGDNVLLMVKPLTFMNNSGFAVKQVVDYYRIPQSQVLIVLDDLDLQFGVLRIRPGGGDAGNRGLRSIIREMGNEEIPRLRFGIRNRDRIANPSSYVLSPFTRKEQASLSQLLPIVCDAIKTWVCQGIDVSMNQFNGNHLET